MTKVVRFRNKLEYCKFGESCRNRHVDDICETLNCDIFSCDKRHPKVCRFLGRLGRCKFLEYCKYDKTIVKVEMEMKKKEKKSFKCCECEFTSGSEKGLKTHLKRMHTIKDIGFPKYC